MSLLSRHRQKLQASSPSRIDAQLPVLQTEIGFGTRAEMLAKHSAKEATMTCCLDGSTSKWGKHQKNPAGILLLSIDLDQGQNERVYAFRMEVVLHREYSGQPAANPGADARELYLIQQPAPRSDRPEPVIYHTGQDRSFAPQVDTPFGGGGLGHRQRSKQWDERRWPWTFSSHWTSSSDDTFDIARWTWEVGSDYPRVELSGPLYAAMALRTPKDHFFLTCQIVEFRVRDDNARFFKMPRDCGASTVQHVRRLRYEDNNVDLAGDIAGLDALVKRLRREADQQPEATAPLP